MATAQRLLPQDARIVGSENDHVIEHDGQIFYPGGVGDRRRLACHECCSFTFGAYGGRGIPYVEQSLTIFLYWKLFPKRFANRPQRTAEWDHKAAIARLKK